jgi:hypothetical protein
MHESMKSGNGMMGTIIFLTFLERTEREIALRSYCNFTRSHTDKRGKLIILPYLARL